MSRTWKHDLAIIGCGLWSQLKVVPSEFLVRFGLFFWNDLISGILLFIFRIFSGTKGWEEYYQSLLVYMMYVICLISRILGLPQVCMASNGEFPYTEPRIWSLYFIAPYKRKRTHNIFRWISMGSDDQSCLIFKRFKRNSHVEKLM